MGHILRREEITKDLDSRREKKERQAKGNMAKNSRKRETRDWVVKLVLKFSTRPKTEKTGGHSVPPYVPQGAKRISK